MVRERNIWMSPDDMAAEIFEIGDLQNPHSNDMLSFQSQVSFVSILKNFSETGQF